MQVGAAFGETRGAMTSARTNVRAAGVESLRQSPLICTNTPVSPMRGAQRRRRQQPT